MSCRSPAAPAAAVIGREAVVAANAAAAAPAAADAESVAAVNGAAAAVGTGAAAAQIIPIVATRSAAAVVLAGAPWETRAGLAFHDDVGRYQRRRVAACVGPVCACIVGAGIVVFRPGASGRTAEV